MNIREIIEEYCTEHYSKEYADYVNKLVSSGVLRPVNPECWLIPNDNVCSLHINLVPLLFEPYSFKTHLRRRVDVRKHFADIALFIRDLYKYPIEEVHLSDLCVYLHMLYDFTKHKHAFHKFLRFFMYSLISSEKLNISIDFYDHFYIMYNIASWNKKQDANKGIASPLYVQEDIKRLSGKLYPSILKCLLDYKDYKKGFYFPKMSFKYSAYNKFDKFSYKVLTRGDRIHPADAFDIVRRHNKAELLNALSTVYDEQNSFFKAFRKYVLCTRISDTKLKERTKFKVGEVVYDKWFTSEGVGKLTKLEPYRPFYDNLSFKQAFAEVVIDYDKYKDYFKEVTVSNLKDHFKEVYLAAHTLNKIRYDKVQTENSSFLPLNVHIDNLYEEEADYALFYIEKITAELHSKELTNYTYTVKYDEATLEERTKRRRFRNQQQSLGAFHEDNSHFNYKNVLKEELGDL